MFPVIAKGLKENKTIDQIRDEHRFAQQSTGFGKVRNAAQQIMVGAGKNVTESTFDFLDDLGPEKSKGFLKRMAIQNAPSADMANQVMGKERTTEFLDEIQGDLDTLNTKGINTNIFSGTRENVFAKIGKVKDPEMRAVATKIALAVMKFRRSMTGVQFGIIEHREYQKLFPSISKTGNFNQATINALRQAFTGDVDKFYSQSMGDENYQNLFQGNDDEYQKYLKAIGG